jgi:hypothetical protein
MVDPIITDNKTSIVNVLSLLNMKLILKVQVFKLMLIINNLLNLSLLLYWRIIIEKLQPPFFFYRSGVIIIIDVKFLYSNEI